MLRSSDDVRDLHVVVVDDAGQVVQRRPVGALDHMIGFLRPVDFDAAALIRAGIHALPCLGDGRQSGTSGSPSILNASPEAAAGGGLALLRTGDRIRVDLKTRRVDLLVDDTELAARRATASDQPMPASQTPWQEIHRDIVGQFDGGAVIESAVKYQRIAEKGLPRDSH